MSDYIFQEAFSRVRGRYDDRSWFALSPREITDTIYREIRMIDYERMTHETPSLVPLAAAAE